MDEKEMKWLLGRTAHINARITDLEKCFLYDIASVVPSEGHIVEIGSCYGASAACMGLGSKNKTHLLLVDIFIHHPAGTASKELLTKNLLKAGVTNYHILEHDTMTLLPWRHDIDLLFIDGAHDYDHVYNDISKFGPKAKVIACHDYTAIKDVKKAVDQFIEDSGELFIEDIVDSIVVLRRHT